MPAYTDVPVLGPAKPASELTLDDEFVVLTRDSNGEPNIVGVDLNGMIQAEVEKASGGLREFVAAELAGAELKMMAAIAAVEKRSAMALKATEISAGKRIYEQMKKNNELEKTIARAVAAVDALYKEKPCSLCAEENNYCTNKTACAHYMCKQCFIQLLGSGAICPMCKQDIMG